MTQEPQAQAQSQLEVGIEQEQVGHPGHVFFLKMATPAGTVTWRFNEEAFDRLLTQFGEYRAQLRKLNQPEPEHEGNTYE